MISRRRSREFLLQSLYARTELGLQFDREVFQEAFFSGENAFEMEQVYLDKLESDIIQHEEKLLAIIAILAPKFDLGTLPVIHILILMIALAELLYNKDLDIPESVTINEAIELAKKFSDDHGRVFINGALSTFLKDREKIQGESLGGTFRVFKMNP